MKLCWLQQKLGAFGGAESNVLQTATALSGRGFHNILLHRERTGLDEERWEHAFAEIYSVPDSAAVLQAVRREQPQAVWIHNWLESADFPALAQTGIPLGRMVHDHALYCLRHYKYHPLTRRNCTLPASAACIFPCLAPLQRGHGRIPIRWADFGAKLREIEHNRSLHRLVVASEFMRGELIKNRFAPEKICILPPVPPEFPEHPAVADLPAERGRILFVGQVIRGKGVDLLLRAVAGLRGEWRLAIAGRGSALAKCEKLRDRLGIGHRVEIYGHLKPDELRAQYQRAQIVAFPSVWQEPFGMVGIEAMRLARPVVAFASGGVPEWLRDGETGLLAPTGDVPGLRAALQKLLDDPGEAARLGVRGREVAGEVFSFSRYIDKLAAMLEELAQKS